MKLPPLLPVTAVPTLPAKPLTALTLCVSLLSGSVSLLNTPLAAATVRVTFSAVVPVSATATGASLLPVTVMVKVLLALPTVVVQVGVSDTGGPGFAHRQVVEGGAGVEAVRAVGGDREAAAVAAGDRGADIAGHAIDGADAVRVAAVRVGVVAQYAAGGLDGQDGVFSSRTGVGDRDRGVVAAGDGDGQGAAGAQTVAVQVGVSDAGGPGFAHRQVSKAVPGLKL